MPLVRVSVSKTRSASEIKAISEGIYEALLDIGVPKDDKFQIFSSHEPESLVFSENYLGIQRSDGFLIIQIFFNQGRSLDLKKQLYQGIADRLHQNIGIRKEDIFIGLVEVPKENWSVGNGIAQYATE